MCIRAVYIVFIETDVLYRLNKSQENPRKTKKPLDKHNVEIYEKLSEKRAGLRPALSAARCQASVPGSSRGGTAVSLKMGFPFAENFSSYSVIIFPSFIRGS